MIVRAGIFLTTMVFVVLPIVCIAIYESVREAQGGEG